jgi:hypothetical protein
VRGDRATFNHGKVSTEIFVGLVLNASTTLQLQMLSQSQSPMMDPRHDHNGFQMPQMAAPPLMNTPPQIFGAYTAHGLPNMDLPDLSQPIFGDGSLMDESIEAKRRRIARVGLVVFAAQLAC